MIQEGERKLMRLEVSRRPEGAAIPPSDFSHGGIYVKTDVGDARNSTRNNGVVPTPTDLASQVLSKWMAFAAPEIRSGLVQAAIDRAKGGAGMVTVREEDVIKRE